MMKRAVTTVVVLLAALAVLSTVAVAKRAPHPTKALHCPKGYVVKHHRVRVKRHGHKVWVRRARCVHKKAKVKVTPTPPTHPTPPTTPAPPTTPLSTTTTATAAQESCDGVQPPPGYSPTAPPAEMNCYTLTTSALDENGNAPPASPMTVTLLGPDVDVGTLTPGSSFTLEVFYTPPGDDLGKSGAWSPDCTVQWYEESYETWSLPVSWWITTSYSGSNGWSASTSSPVMLTP
jgi:hypothetical protein